jgi:superfamily II DNA or RNA helicase/HKD family nuclease
MSRISRGLYQSLITEALAKELESLETNLRARYSDLHYSEVADRLAMHLSNTIARAIESIEDGRRVGDGIALARELITRLDESTNGDLLSELPTLAGQFLTGVLAIQPDGRPEGLSEPLIPLLDTALLTNAPGEPRVGHQIVAEIPSADRIDFIMAFIRLSGIRPMLEALRRHCEAGRKLRILTTVYTGSTEGNALDQLKKLGADIRVSYDTSSTRLHAKAWLFHRQSGFSTAYIGSSNLTHSAQVSGLEWNVRISAARNGPVVDKVAAVFESYWHSEDFCPFDLNEFSERGASHGGATGLTYLSPIELRPEPFQERLLEQIALSRQRGFHRNLLVSATGTGKTVMAAVDYARLKETLPRARLLFVAHRNEILQQSLVTFRQAIRDSSFGETWVGGARPQVFDHVFASIQSLSATGLERLDAKHFDVVIVDEFHHAAAPSYRALLDHVKPIELLGLTATPERSDGLSLLHWFGDRIAAELRLWDAIDQQRLVPFVYYGIADSLDFTEVPWHRGRGYDVEELTNLFTANDAWARLVIQALTEKIDDVPQMRALGFCVSIDHARFMARVFNKANIPSIAIWADTHTTDREKALRDLKERRVNVVFSVDIFNEGVDVPSVDTLIMLRPTDSPTLFLQQLGRGLRRHHGKSACTVIDFVGLHNQKFRFDRRLTALLGGTRKDVERQVAQGFPFLPAGCHMELDRIASQRVLRSIRNAVPDRWPNKVEELRGLAAGGHHVALAAYLDATGLALEDVYASGRSWSDLLAAAGLPVLEAGPAEEELRRTGGRLLHVDDAARIEAYKRILSSPITPTAEDGSVVYQRYLRMLVASVVGRAVALTASLQEACNLMWQHPQVIAELLELMNLLLNRIEHVENPLDDKPTLPLSVHAQYTRIEIQAAFGDGDKARVPAWREGVRWMKGEKCDVFVFTLDKTSGRFSPTTRYRDYAISRELIHWESQSMTRADSPTGRRYQSHDESGSAVMLFARLRDDDRAFYFLGPAEYVSHESEMPMAITWRLKTPLPGDLFQSFAAAVA